MHRTILEAYAFGAHLGNWSVFIMDPHLLSVVTWWPPYQRWDIEKNGISIYQILNKFQ